VIKRLIALTNVIYTKPHILYTVIAMMVGLGFAIFTPPFHGPDEETHFLRAYQIVRGDIVLEEGDEPGRVGSCLPREIHDVTVASSHSPSIRGFTSIKYDYSGLDELIVDEVENPGDCRFTITTNTYSYNPVAYVPALTGVGVVNVFNGPPLLAMYIARIFSVLVTVMLFAIAIKLLPYKKYMFVVILLTPMLLFQQAVISIDGFSYAIFAVFVAYLVRLYNSKNISNKQWLVLGSLAVLLTCLKPLLYLFIPAVLLLLSASKIKPLLIILVSVASIGLSTIAINTIYPEAVNSGPPGVNQEVQISNLKDDPLRAVRVAWNTYMNPYGDGQTLGVIGVFGAADTKIPLWVYTVSVVNIALALFFTHKKDTGNRVNRWFRLVLLGIICLYFAAVNAAMYLTYSPVNFDIIYGVQGRYFLPILICLPLIFMGGIALRSSDARRLNRNLIISTSFVLVVSLIVLFQRYYLYTP